MAKKKVTETEEKAPEATPRRSKRSRDAAEEPAPAAAAAKNKKTKKDEPASKKAPASPPKKGAAASKASNKKTGAEDEAAAALTAIKKTSVASPKKAAGKKASAPKKKAPAKKPAAKKPPKAKAPKKKKEKSARSVGGYSEAVEQLDLVTGAVLNEYASVSAAAEAVGCQRPGISQCLSGTTRSCKGFYWRYKGSQALPSANRKGPNAVEQLDMTTGKVLKEFKSCLEASKAVGVGKNQIHLCVKGGKRSAAGFFWRYKGSDAMPEKRDTSKRKVVQIDMKSGNRIRRYQSIDDAVEAVGFEKGGILGCLMGESGEYGGSKWQFVTAPGPGRAEETPIKRITAGIVQDYPSAREAAHEMAVQAIQDCLDGKTKSYAAFRWEYVKDENRYDKRSNQICVEQLDLRTSEVLNEFKSLSDAARQMGRKSAFSSIASCCKGVQKQSLGFFWRYKGSDELPAPDAYDAYLRTTKRAVEQLDYNTGEVLNEYESVAAAAKAVGSQITHMTQACNGSARMCKGFFWRFKGSNSLPAARRQGPRTVEQVDIKTGKPIKEFVSVWEAAKECNCERQDISDVIFGITQQAGGYFWRYQGSDALPDSIDKAKAPAPVLAPRIAEVPPKKKSAASKKTEDPAVAETAEV